MPHASGKFVMDLKMNVDTVSEKESAKISVNVNNYVWGGKKKGFVTFLFYSCGPHSSRHVKFKPMPVQSSSLVHLS
jgi:hypothetical protein